MKKIYLLSLLFVSCLYGCQDVNDDFDWLDDALNNKDKQSYTYTIVEADYATIASAASGSEYESAAKQLQANKVFSEAIPADKLIPFLLSKKYYAANIGSSALVTYQYNTGRDETVTNLTSSEDSPAYILENEDYKFVWGEPYATALTPSTSPEKLLPSLLSNKFEAGEKDTVKAGSYRVIEYSYSEAEPVSVVVEGSNIYTQDFEDLDLKANDPIAIEGWLNVDVTGKRSWQMKSHNENFYAQASANGSKEINNNWLILPVDLTQSTNPHLTFMVKIGYYNSSCLSIKVSDNFDGNEANIGNANWKDITTSFNIPQTPTSGYGDNFESAGFGSLVEYKGKNVYIAFHYAGNDTSTPKATTTYQIDDIKITEAEVGKEVEKKETRFVAYYKKSNNKKDWTPAASYIEVLQPTDYESLNLSNNQMTKEQALELLPVHLSEKYPKTVTGDLVIVYKDTKDTFRADRVVCKGSRQWEVANYIETKDAQFVMSENGWIFDPTVTITLAKSDFQLIVDHVKGENSSLVTDDYIETRYGFNSKYSNISFRTSDRDTDPDYPKGENVTEEDITKFCKETAIKGLVKFLTLIRPNAQPTVGGVDQFAKLTVTIYYGPRSTNVENFLYEFQCVGDKEWKYLQRTSLATGKVEKAEE